MFGDSEVVRKSTFLKQEEVKCIELRQEEAVLEHVEHELRELTLQDQDSS